MIPNLKTETQKEAYGHTWEWRGSNPTMRRHWKSTSGNLVLIFPPTETISSWYVNVCDDECYELTGKDVEDRAFCVAETYTRQSREGNRVQMAHL